MNLSRIRAVRDAIAAHKEKFNMETWLFIDELPSELLHNCNTVGCIAGFTVAVFNPNHYPTFIEAAAKAILELTQEESSYLFFGQWAKKDISLINADDAIAKLDRVLATGRIIEEEDPSQNT